MIKPNYISYKDSAARVIKNGSIFYRSIFYCYKTEYDHLMYSGLYDELTKKGLLIQHEEISLKDEQPDVYKLLLPVQLDFQSYPFEWSYHQWRKAALAYLTINLISLKYGMILKDASPYNFSVIFDRVIMFDTSSFIFFNENDKWIAYKQFCEEFLSPIALMHYNGQNWSKLYSSQLRGLRLNFVSKQLPLKSWFNLCALLHIHLHAYFVNTSSVQKRTNSKGFSLEKVKSLFSQIKSNVDSWVHPYFFNNHWVDYYINDIETTNYLDSKEEVIKVWLSKIKPISVLDLGANTGRFSFIASMYTKKVIALESDETCVDEIMRQISLKKCTNIFPTVVDLSAPSPALGLMNKETLDIFHRAKSSMVFGLALIHHLYFIRDMSFAHIAELFSKFCYDYLIVEFIPIEDRKVKEFTEVKPQRANNYNLESFKVDLLTYFDHIESKPLTSSFRILILLKKSR